MVFSRFCLGLRFVVRPEGREATETNAWNLLFSVLSPKEAVDLELHGLWKEADASQPNACYLCALSGLSLDRMRKVYARLVASPLLRSELDLLSPIYQLNQMMLMEGFSYLGKSDASGKVSSGDCSIGKMRFFGKYQRKTTKNTVLLAFESAEDVVTAEQAIRSFMKAMDACGVRAECIPLPVEKKATALIKNMIPVVGGRFDLHRFSNDVDADALISVGILPDLTVAVAARNTEAALACVEKAQAQGFSKFIIAPGSSVSDELRTQFTSQCTEALENAEILLLDDTVTTEQCLDLLYASRLLKKADCVIVAAKNMPEFSEILKNSRRKPFQKILPLPLDYFGTKSETEAIEILQTSAKMIFGR